MDDGRVKIFYLIYPENITHLADRGASTATPRAMSAYAPNEYSIK